MPKVSVQFCNFSSTVVAAGPDGQRWLPAHMLPGKLGPRIEIDVTASATADGNRPTNTAGEGFTHAICIPLDGQVLVEAALDPTANQSSRLLALSGLEYAVLVPEGHKLSFVTRS